MLAFILIVLGIFSRLISNIPNFTPVMAIALFSGVYLNKKYAIFIPLVLMMISDLIIGLHDVIIFTWGSFLLMGLIGRWLKNHKNIYTVIGASIFSSVLFFIITNFGVWLVGQWYPRTITGLIRCYAMAIPFFRVNLLSTLLFTVVLFGIYEIAKITIKSERLSKILLVKETTD